MDWLDVVFEAQAEHAAGVLFQPTAGRPAAFELAPEADDIDPVDEAEHDEVDDALLVDDHDGWSHDEWNDGWSCDERNDGWSSVGWHEGCEQTYDNSASSFSLGGSDIGATSYPKRFEWVKMNLDTGAAVNTFPLNFGPDGAGDGRFHRTASGEWILDGGAWQFQGYDENGLLRSLNGRLTGAHKVLCSAADIECKEQQDFFVGHDGGYMIPIHSQIGQEMRVHFEKLLSEYGRNELIPVYFESDTPNFYLNREVKSEETHSVRDAEQCFGKESQQSGNEHGRAVRL